MRRMEIGRRSWRGPHPELLYQPSDEEVILLGPHPYVGCGHHSIIDLDASPYHFLICFLSDLIPIADANDLAVLLG